MMSEIPVALQIESSIPPDCSGCKTAEMVCAALAQEVKSAKTMLDDAKTKLEQDLLKNCPGKITRPAGWANRVTLCRYEAEV